MCKQFTTLLTNIDNNMIDKKDIQKAASSKHNPAFGVYGYLAARTAFAAGVEWFKKALWHSQDEIPEADRLILVKDWIKDVYLTFDTTKELDLEDFDKELQWKVFCTSAEADFTWCYIEDLLPNK